jgi:NAD(P)-dependent dehydrogenase (short-subunit alcohol dehydrogenase family)
MVRSSPSNRFGSRTTAEQARDGVSLEGKTAIVTGASSGIGVETARVLAIAGAHVVMACRSVASGESVARELRSQLPTAGRESFAVEALDLSDLTSVRGFAERFAATKRPLHLLVNNAGIMATPLGRTAQGSELQVGTNHVGHFLLTKLLRPLLETSAPARIVTVSSALHTRGRAERLFETLDGDPGFTRRKYAPFDAYADSKLANVLFTRQLAKDLPPSVKTFSLHPGVIATNLTRSMGVAGSVFRTVGTLFTKSIAQGAATTIVAATSPALETESGAYLSDCQVVQPSRDARDDANAAKLWEISERLVAGFATPLAR